MKRIITFTIAFIILFGTVSCFAQTTNKKLVKEYCNTHYKGYRVVYLNKYDEKTITTRKGKHIVYVEIITSISSGKIDKRNGRCWGYLKGDNYYKMWYNVKVKKGKTVKSYCVYNPHTNYFDDIVAVIDNKKIR